MKAMKKLIPAICLLLISAVLLGTSTYAWFSMNTTVTAEGMKVEATSAKNLVISNTSTLKQDEASHIASTNSDTMKLFPASTTSPSDNTFFYVSNSEGVDYTSGKGNIGTEFAKVSFTDGNQYVSKHTFYIRVDGEANSELYDLYVKKITVNDTTDSSAADKAITQALRVGIVTTNKTVIYAPLAGATLSYNAINAAGEVASYADGIYKNSSDGALNAATTAIDGSAATLAYNANVNLAATVGTETYVEVTIYIWYEGEDEDCTSAKSVDVENVTVSVDFEAVISDRDSTGA